MSRIKIFKKKGTTICDGADLQRACKSGKADAIRGDGEVADPASVASLTNTMFDIPSLILELNNMEFANKINSDKRNLRSVGCKKLNKK
jgi:hypothetical protein